MNWIPVDKRLPKENERISIVSIIEKGQPRVVQTYFLGNEYIDFNNGKWYWHGYCYFDCSRHVLDITDMVVAWMPYPKPYTKKGDLNDKT